MRRIGMPAVLAALCILCACGENGGGMMEQQETAGEMMNFGMFGVRRVFFGHKSVGAGIVRGLAALPVGEKVVQTRLPPLGDGPFFAHAELGENGNAVSKLDDFSSLVRGGFGDAADIVLMKFCWADIRTDDEAVSAFRAYEKTVTALEGEFPRTVFVHVTVPLVTAEDGPEVSVKRILGRRVRGYEDNLARSRYNGMLRERFGGTEPVFDLAAVESTLPDGSVLYRTINGDRFPVLFPGYASDYGHLSAAAARGAAARLAAFLGSIPVRK